MKTILIEGGHGGIIKGIYQTKGKRSPKYKAGVLYEGEFNRAIVARVIKMMQEEGIPYVNVAASNMDISLDDRVDFANDLYRTHRNAVYISIHANAGGGTGFEVFTSPGQTASDGFAETIIEELAKGLPQLRLRSDDSDGDHDKEARFYVLTQTRMPSVLIECAFMDKENPDYTLLKSEKGRDLFARSIFNGIKRIANAA